MNKKQWIIPLSAIMTIGLAGCNGDNNNRAGVNGKNNVAQPMGYYSNENHSSQDNLFGDNDGGITEIMDHTVGNEDQLTTEHNRRILQNRDENGNPTNPTKPLATKDRNFFQHDNRFSTSDMNYHGHLSKNTGNTGVATDSDFQDNVTAKIRRKVASVKNVQDVRSVAYGNSVIVSVKLADNSKAAETKRAIKNAVMPYTKGRNVTVLTDEGTMGRDRNKHNDSQPHKWGQ
ncbi:YhcN/YlaJ family sporulation lipoprotein [Bacillus sp. 1P10SD]|uniref:YhcN/YlaJ family sporulation lipoprotein n=1 Tax=Bacillus sp. 1P10SD TaxID=3132265 RepID=UPI0039A4188F